MPEIRVTVSEKFDKLLETGLFASKADILRFATIMYLKELGFIGKRKAETGNSSTLKSKPESQSP
jgi:Arc/MetJ-type ribon-helix-helix transcriptional regulator